MSDTMLISLPLFSHLIPKLKLETTYHYPHFTVEDRGLKGVVHTLTTGHGAHSEQGWRSSLASPWLQVQRWGSRLWAWGSFLHTKNWADPHEAVPPFLACWENTQRQKAMVNFANVSATLHLLITAASANEWTRGIVCWSETNIDMTMSAGGRIRGNVSATALSPNWANRSHSQK